MYFHPEHCKLKIGNEILERIGTDCTKKIKFVGLKIDEFLNWTTPWNKKETGT